MKKIVKTQKTFFRNKVVTKKYLKEILFWSFRNFGMVRSVFLVDSLKQLGFYYATQGGISISIEDLKVPPLKTETINLANQEMDNAEFKCFRGELTEVERYQQLADNWNITSETLKNQVVNYLKNFDPLNPVYMMAFSGARGNLSQVRQLVGIRGLMAGPTGDIIDIPITKNFREGLTITDYMISAYGARKGLVDTALKTADSGYLTRRLVDVAQDVLIREIDCFTNRGIFLFKLDDGNGTIVSLRDRILGRILAKDVFQSKTNEIIGVRNQQISPVLAKRIEEEGIPQVIVRSPLTCELTRSVCQKCYGWNLAQAKAADLGEAIGIVAAQSIGEPGTQLTMRTFHTGGVFTAKSSGQVFSKVSGQIFLPSKLETFSIRTSRGTEGLVLKDNAKIEIVNFRNQVYQVSLEKETILFVKNKEFVKKGQILALLHKTLKTFGKKEKRSVFSSLSGEIFFNKKQSAREKIKPAEYAFDTNQSGLLWVLSGKVFNIPQCAKITQYKFSKLKPLSSFAKIKLSTYKGGVVKVFPSYLSNQRKSYKLKLLVENFLLENSEVYKGFYKKNFSNDKKFDQCIVKTGKNKFFYLNGKLNFNFKKESILGEQINTSYRTKTGGLIHYVKLKLNSFTRKPKNKKYEVTQGGGILFLPEETFLINKDVSVLKVEGGTWVDYNTELATNVYNKVPGFVQVIETNNIVNKIIVKPGSFINLKNEAISYSFDKKLLFPGEQLFDTYEIKDLTYCEIFNSLFGLLLLLRPVHLYELPKVKREKNPSNLQGNGNKFKEIVSVTFKNGQRVFTGRKSAVNLIKTKLIFKNTERNLKGLKANVSFSEQQNKQISLEFNVFENIFSEKDIPNGIDSNQLNFSLFLKDGHYVEPYTLLGNIDLLSRTSLRIKHLKERKHNQYRRVLIVSDDDYKTLFSEDKNNIEKSRKFIRAGDLIGNKQISLNSGKIIKNNGNILKIRKAKPFLFSEGAEVFWFNKDFIKEHEELGALFYEKAQTGDIVQGLPKVEEVLEARRSKVLIKSPKNPGIALNILRERKKNSKFIYVSRHGFNFYSLANKQELFMNPGIFTDVGYPINARLGNPHITINYLNYCYKMFLEPYEASYRSLRKTQSYLVNAIQGVYNSQGVHISDKHLEVIVKQMTSKIRVNNRGDSGILPGEYIDLEHTHHMNTILRKTNAKEIFYRPILLGITKASLLTESFVSAASFQETVRVLTEAAIEGKVDWLKGLKENVIIGRLIPAGTGFNAYEHISDLSVRLPKTKTSLKKLKKLSISDKSN